MLFAHLKHNLGLRRLRLYGLTSVKDEFLLAATVQNLKKLVRLCASGPPIATKCALFNGIVGSLRPVGVKVQTS
jgi:hypothetical protein